MFFYEFTWELRTTFIEMPAFWLETTWRQQKCIRINNGSYIVLNY